MPTKSYTEIITETKDYYKNYETKLSAVDEEIKNIKYIINKANELGGEQNIISRANILLDKIKWERQKLEMSYNYFYHRLDSLNLLNHES